MIPSLCPYYVLTVFLIPCPCYFFQDISVSVSVLTLTFIAYDRYHAICKPLQFSSQRRKAALVIGAIW